MRGSPGAFLLSAVFILSAAGQQRPNFSGRWELVGNGNQARIDTIDHRDPTLWIKTEIHDTSTSTIPRPLAGLILDHTYLTDGTERRSGEQWNTTYWQGSSSLVLLNVKRNGYRVEVTREVWTLSDSDQTLTKTRRVVNMDGVTETTLVFRKQ